MSDRDDMCVCGHPRHEHCFCGMHCMHPGDPVPKPEKLLSMLAAALAVAIEKGKREAIEHLMASPLGYENNCRCDGFKMVDHGQG
jgi:hypothetical protein